jgi:hypothetical protein
MILLGRQTRSKVLIDGLVYLDRLLSVRLFEIAVVDVGRYAELRHSRNESLGNKRIGILFSHQVIVVHIHWRHG